MTGIYMAGVFLTLLGLGFGFFYRIEEHGPRAHTNRGREGGEKE